MLSIRFLGIFQPPYTDEGAYVACAWILMRLPADLVPDFAPTSLNLYSSLIALFLPSDSNPLILMRWIDAVIASCFSAIHFLLLHLISRSLFGAIFIAIISGLLLNNPLFINAGFKNPAFLAFLFFTTGILLWGLVATAEERKNMSWRKAALIAACFAACVASREQFGIYILACAVALMLFGRWNDCIKIFSLSLGLFILIVLFISILRGNPILHLQGIFATYTKMLKLFPAMEIGYNMYSHRVAMAKDAIGVTAWAVIPAFLIIIISMLIGSKNIKCREYAVSTRWLFFGIVLSLCSFVEFFSKMGFPYHLSYCIFGISLSCAGAYSIFVSRFGLHGACFIGVIMGISMVTFPSVKGNEEICVKESSLYLAIKNYKVAINLSGQFQNAVAGDWSDPMIEESYYLSTAACLRENAKPNDSLLVGSGLILYPLTGIKPWNPAILDYLTFLMAKSVGAENGQPESIPFGMPNLIVETNRYPAFKLKSIFPSLETDYNLVAEIPTGKSHYGQFACRIWRLRNK